MEAYYHCDTSLEALAGKTVGIIGYGNQGKAQALNLRDSGIDVRVGALRDESAVQAESDGFQVDTIETTVEATDVVAFLVPDEVQQGLLNDSVQNNLRPGQTLNFAHGYNIHFGLITPPKFVDVIMVAPRMIGVTIREAYRGGAGAPAYIAVHQDSTGHALSMALAFAHGIGATRAGVFKTSFAHETELDLFLEQGLWPLLVRSIITAYEVLVEKGYPPELVALDMYGSEEACEIFHEMARVGFFKQMKFHSQTSQYGTLSRSRQLPFAPQLKEFMEGALAAIQTGRFAEEWRVEQETNYHLFRELGAEAAAHPLNEAETRMRHLLRY